ncbi:hypothetical protein MMC34_008524 [Xylographa carneopallida]|nr:hypothetical protein [Xylographa carneopallida]
MGIAVFDGCLGLKVLVVAGSIGGVDVMMVKIVELLEDKVNIGLSRIVIRYKAPTNAALQLIGQGSEAEISCALAVIVEQMAKAESSDDKTFNIYTMGMYVNASMKDVGDIGVITPYKEQKCPIIRNNLGEAQKRNPVKGIADVGVATFDACKDRESEVMVNNLTGIDVPKGRAGHMQDARRLNVVLTRAEKAMFVVMDFLAPAPPSSGYKEAKEQASKDEGMEEEEEKTTLMLKGETNWGKDEMTLRLEDETNWRSDDEMYS